MTFSDDMYHTGIIDHALELRMGANGAGDPGSREDVAQTKAYLRMRLDTWKESSPFSKRFDDAIREAVEAALAECEARNYVGHSW